MQEQSGIFMPVSSLIPGRNPRQYFDEAEMQELESSIRAQGVIQPLLVRPVADGKLEIIAGERRWRAATSAGLVEIPVLVKEMNDAEADAAALTENRERAAMSPTEEAEAAARILGRCSGDREEAARRLGWKVGTLEKRLALMNCSESVRKALNERKINLGHAELLAAVTREKQSDVLGKMLAAPDLPTVPQLKAMLEQIAQSLDVAIFNKDACVGCPHNSGTQQALFSEAIAGAKCTNAACYQGKTDEALEVLAGSLKDDYPMVRIVRPGENFTILKLVADGHCGVGDEQAKHCRACANFGAAVSAVPGKVGNVYRDQCFDPACNSTKVAERIKAEKEASSTETPPDSGDVKAKPAAAKQLDKKKSKSTANPKVEDSQRIKDYRVAVWRKVFKLEAQKPSFSHVLLLSLALEGKLGKVGHTALSKAFGTLTGGSESSRINLLETAQAVMKAGDDTVQRMLSGVAASCFDGLEEIDIKRLLTFMQADLSAHWVLNGEYLNLLTKSEMQVIAEELGIVTHLGEKFGKLMSGKKEEIIKSLLAIADFDYKGKVPGHLKYDR